MLCASDDQPLARFAGVLERALFGEDATLPRSLASGHRKALVGSFDGSDGTRMVIEESGEQLTAIIHWPNHPQPSRFSIGGTKDANTYTLTASGFHLQMVVTKSDAQKRATQMELNGRTKYRRSD